MTDDELFQIGLLKLCQDLHMSNTGTGDPFTPAKEIAVRMYLRKRHADWEPTKASAERYDTAVRALVEAALVES